MTHTIEKLERRFEVGPSPRVFVDDPGGSISIVASDEQAIRITVSGYDSEELEGAEPIVCTHEGDYLRVHKNKSVDADDLDIRVAVPAQCVVEISTTDADVSAHGIEADLQVQTGDGEVSAIAVQGTTRIRTAGGDISMDDVRGDVVVETTDGDFNARDLHASLRATSANGELTILCSKLVSAFLEANNGDIELETSLVPEGVYGIHIPNGDTEIRLPPETGADVLLKSDNGELSCRLPAKNVEKSKKKWSGRLGDGGAKITVESANGDIKVSTWTKGFVQCQRDKSAHRHVEPAPSLAIAAPVETVTPLAPVTPLEPWTPLEPGTPIEPLSSMEPIMPMEPLSPMGPAGPVIGVGHNELTIEILSLLERGEINVEEAMSKLDQLH
jgi:DUF4097 and DUF4098 domain-containing protein YvlB